MLTIRTWAVFGRGKRLAYGLFGFFGVMVIIDIVVVGLYLRSLTGRPSALPVVDFTDYVDFNS